MSITVHYNKRLQIVFCLLKVHKPKMIDGLYKTRSLCDITDSCLTLKMGRGGAQTSQMVCQYNYPESKTHYLHKAPKHGRKVNFSYLKQQRRCLTGSRQLSDTQRIPLCTCLQPFQCWVLCRLIHFRSHQEFWLLPLLSFFNIGGYHLYKTKENTHNRDTRKEHSTFFIHLEIFHTQKIAIHQVVA